MARTAPVPDIPPIPGMCPSVAVLAGGGDGGGGGGDGAGDGSGDQNAGAGSGGDAAGGDGRGAPGSSPQAVEGHPIDAITGRAWTFPALDLSIPGPLPLFFERRYSSAARDRDMGLGPGWSHTLGWEIEEHRRFVRVWTDEGLAFDFPSIAPGAEVIGPYGYLLRRTSDGYDVDVNDGLLRGFRKAITSSVLPRFLLTSVADRNDNRITLRWSDAGLDEVIDSAGRRIRFSPAQAPSGRVASVAVLNAAAQGRWITLASYTYDDRGDLAAVTDADGHTSRYRYDAEHRLVEEENRAGVRFFFRYDERGRCVETWGEAREPDPSLDRARPKHLSDGVTPVKGIYHRKLDYHEGRYTEVSDTTTQRRYFGNARGTVDKAVAGGGVSAYAYDTLGNVVARSDALGSTTSFERDARGRLTAITDPLGRATAITRDAHGLPIAVVDPAGGVTEATRDRNGNVIAVRDAAGGVTTYERDARGLITAIHGPTGATTRLAYDAHGNLVEQTLPNGGARRFTYDALGRRTSATDPTGAVTRYHYSPRGDLIAVERRDGGRTDYRYNGEGHLVWVRQPDGAASSITWSSTGKLASHTDANGAVTRFVYDLEGRLAFIENNQGERHRAEHDAIGRLVAEETFDGRRVRYKHDAVGRVTAITEGALATINTYDAAGQLVKRELADGGVVNFAYDGRGAMIAAEGPEGSVLFERDAMGRVIRETVIADDEPISVERRYDPAGLLAERATSLGHSARFERDVMGSPLRTVLDDEHAIASRFDGTGREIARALAGGGSIESAFDPLGRLLARAVVGPGDHTIDGAAGEPSWVGEAPQGSRLDKRYRYDAAGRLSASWQTDRGLTGVRYDPGGQLAAITRELDKLPPDTPSEVFSHDRAGNVVCGGERRVYGPGGRLLERGDTTYSWDDQGRLAEKRRRGADGREERWAYTWNEGGMLASVDGPDGTRTSFTYDPFGRRLFKIVARKGAGATFDIVSRTRFVWDGDALVHEIKERAAAHGDPVVEERTYLFDEQSLTPLAHRDKRQGAFYHYVSGPSGTPEEVVSDRGDVMVSLRTKAFGRTEERVLGDEGARTPIRFQGQYEDRETGLHYNRYRYYDPDTGQFISADPIGVRGGFQLYAYPTDPINILDPLGLTRPAQPPDVAAGRAAARSAVTPSIQAGFNQASQDAGAAPGTGGCAYLANAYSQANPGSQVITMYPQGSSELQTWNGVGPQRGNWNAHAAVQMPNGQIHDPDQGMVFPNRDAWVRGTSAGPVTTSASPPPPRPGSGGGGGGHFDDWGDL